MLTHILSRVYPQSVQAKRLRRVANAVLMVVVLLEYLVQE